MPYIHKTSLTYPVSEQEIRAANPSMSFPAAFAHADYAWVFSTPKPAYNPLTQKVVTVQPTLNQLGNYEEAFEVVALNAGELAAIEAELPARKARLITKIDSDVDFVYETLLGRRSNEYTEAERQALAYIAANYTGTVPAFVADWAAAESQTATWAADSIAAKATAWRAAQASMRANRLQHKSSARNAATIAALETVEAAWNAYFAALKTSLEI